MELQVHWYLWFILFTTPNLWLAENINIHLTQKNMYSQRSTFIWTSLIYFCIFFPWSEHQRIDWYLLLSILYFLHESIYRSLVSNIKHSIIYEINSKTNICAYSELNFNRLSNVSQKRSKTWNCQIITNQRMQNNNKN